MEILGEIKDAPKIITRLSDEVRSVDAALNLLNGVEEREWVSLGTTVAEESKTTISTYKTACDLFRSDLERWTKHSEDGKLAWQDRANVGFFKKAQIKAMSEQLQNCKLSISTVVSLATLYVGEEQAQGIEQANNAYRYSSVRNSPLTEEIKNSISAKRDEVSGAITTTDNQVVVLENRLKELELSSDEEDETMSAQCKAEVLQRLKNERDALDASRKLLQELLAKSQEESVAKAALGSQNNSTTISFGEKNSGFQAGIINGAVSGLTFGGE